MAGPSRSTVAPVAEDVEWDAHEAVQSNDEERMFVPAPIRERGLRRLPRWAAVPAAATAAMVLLAAWPSARKAARVASTAVSTGAAEALDEVPEWRRKPDADMMWQAGAMRQAMETQGADAEEEAKLLAQEAQKRTAAEEARELAAAKARREHEAERAKTAELSMFLRAADDIVHPAPMPLPARASGGYKLLPVNTSCALSGLLPIDVRTVCEDAARELALSDTTATETGREGVPEGCYLHNQNVLFVGFNLVNKGRGSDCMGQDTRQQVCMTPSKKKEFDEAALKEALEARKQREAEERAREEAERKKAKDEALRAELMGVKKWEQDEANVPNVSFYCFSLMLPFGYEPGLLKEQQRRGVGIFACEESMVFSNMTTFTSGEKLPVAVQVIEGSLSVTYGGRWMTALNTGVFNRIWMKVINLGNYRNHDWVVKVDPDAVFFPSRLRQLLRHTTPFNDAGAQRQAPEPKEWSCGNCQLEGKQHETCAARVRSLQKDGHSCKAALQTVSRAPPHDCGCACDDFACDMPESAMYLNNCKWGLHGPIEVLSRRAVAMYAAGLPRCVPLLQHPWGEDKFLDECMETLGIKRVNEWSLLSEIACGETPAPCGTSKVSFHPFKTIQSYFTCYEYADTYGGSPGAEPSLPEDLEGNTWQEMLKDLQAREEKDVRILAD